MKLPKEIEEELKQYAQVSEIDYEDIKAEYEKEFMSEFIQKDPSFEDDKARHKYLIISFNRDYVQRAKTKEYTVIPFGMTMIKKKKDSNIPSCNLYAYTKQDGEDNFSVHRILMKGIDNVKKVKTMNWLCKYEGVRLCQFRVKEGKERKDDGDLIADDRTKFLDPVKTNTTHRKIAEKFKLEPLTIKDAINNLSGRDEKGYVKPMELRMIRGLIKRISSENEDPMNEKTNIVITDDSCGIEPVVLPNGTTESPGVTVWLSKHMIKHDKDAYIDAIGLTRERRVKDPDDKEKYIGTKTVVMDGIFTIGIHEKPKEE